MQVNIILLDYLRHEFTESVKKINFNNAGYLFDFIQINKKGISAAYNEGLQKSKQYDAVVFMANDIYMPDNWLNRMVQCAEAIPNTGCVGIHCVEGLEKATELNGQLIHETYTAFGNVLTPMKAVNRIGYYNPDYDPYGMQDADYAYRLKACGFINYYIAGMKAEHIGHDVGSDSDYRKMKNEGLQKAAEVWIKATKHYKESNNYTIFLKETL